MIIVSILIRVTDPDGFYPDLTFERKRWITNTQKNFNFKIILNLDVRIRPEHPDLQPSVIWAGHVVYDTVCIDVWPRLSKYFAYQN